jgi:hypothetical protein
MILIRRYWVIHGWSYVNPTILKEVMLFDSSLIQNLGVMFTKLASIKVNELKYVFPIASLAF